MADVKYKNFELSPHPHQFVDTKNWLVGITITKSNGGRGKTREKLFFSNKSCDGKRNAECHFIRFGKEIIDGKHAKLSVGTL